MHCSHWGALPPPGSLTALGVFPQMSAPHYRGAPPTKSPYQLMRWAPFHRRGVLPQMRYYDFYPHGWVPPHVTEGATLTGGHPHGRHYVLPSCGWAPTSGGRCRPHGCWPPTRGQEVPPRACGCPHGGQKVSPRGWAPTRETECGTKRRWAPTRASQVTAPAYRRKRRHLLYPCSSQKNSEGRNCRHCMHFLRIRIRACLGSPHRLNAPSLLLPSGGRSS